MPRKKAFDAKKLVKMVKDETHQQEIMKAFGFKTSAQVKTAYMNALIETGKAKPETLSNKYFTLIFNRPQRVFIMFYTFLNLIPTKIKFLVTKIT
jgi:hypothetical protein